MPKLEIDVSMAGTNYHINSPKDAIIFGEALARCIHQGFTARIMLVLMNSNSSQPGDKIGQIH